MHLKRSCFGTFPTLVLSEFSVGSLSAIRYSQSEQEFIHILSNPSVGALIVEIVNIVLLVALSGGVTFDILSKYLGSARNAEAKLLNILELVIRTMIGFPRLPVGVCLARYTILFKSFLGCLSVLELFSACRRLLCLIDRVYFRCPFMVLTINVLRICTRVKAPSVVHIQDRVSSSPAQRRLNPRARTLPPPSISLRASKKQFMTSLFHIVVQNRLT